MRALNDYSGAVIAHHHDHLIDASADRLWLVADGTGAQPSTATWRTTAAWF